MTLIQKLNEKGLSSGPVFATRIMKGYEAAQMVAAFKENKGVMTK